MLIECPICHARAQLPQSKEGAKVRCGECGRVYIARPPGAKAARSQTNTGAIIGIGVAVVALAVFVLISKSGGDDEPARAAAKSEEPEEEVFVDQLSWDGPYVQVVARLHEAVFGYDEAAVRGALHTPNIWLRAQVEAAAELAEAELAETGLAEAELAETGLAEAELAETGLAAGAEAEEVAQPTEAGPAPVAPTVDEFHLLAQAEKDAFLDQVVEELLRGDERELVGEWAAYDGSVVEITDDDAVVHLALRPREAGNVEKRTIEWKLTRDGTRWKAWSWERYYSPEELAAKRRRIERGYEKVTLSDGSKVFEREPEPLTHLEDTSPELAGRIDQLYATMIDLDLTKESSRAQQELVDIGRPAIPILLTGLYEIPLDTEDQAKQVNLIVGALRRISGEYMGFKPMANEGSGVGTTDERRNSAIKQWFAWWWRKQDKFTEKETTDGLEGLIELTDKEKRWLERNQDK